MKRSEPPSDWDGLLNLWLYAVGAVFGAGCGGRGIGYPPGA
jgi:hypothetical protein